MLVLAPWGWQGIVDAAITNVAVPQVVYCEYTERTCTRSASSKRYTDIGNQRVKASTVATLSYNSSLCFLQIDALSHGLPSDKLTVSNLLFHPTIARVRTARSCHVDSTIPIMSASENLFATAWTRPLDQRTSLFNLPLLLSQPLTPFYNQFSLFHLQPIIFHRKVKWKRKVKWNCVQRSQIGGKYEIVLACFIIVRWNRRLCSGICSTEGTDRPMCLARNDVTRLDVYWYWQVVTDMNWSDSDISTLICYIISIHQF